MHTREIIRDNLPRIAGMIFFATAIRFDIASILQKETEERHQNYNISMMIAPLGGMMNMTGRIVDHWGNPEKRKNILAGCIAIGMMAVQMLFSASTLFSDFKQPISLPPLMGAIVLSFVTALNWEGIRGYDHCKARIKKNAGRITAFAGAAATISFAIPSIILNEQRLFFATVTAASLTSVAESSNRVLDIIWTHKDQTNVFNKGCAAVFFSMMLSDAIASGLATAAVWKQPIAFSFALSHSAVFLFMLAQFKFSREPAIINDNDLTDRIHSLHP